MLNVTVINLKSIGKYLLLTIVLVGIFWLSKTSSKNISFTTKLLNINLVGCISDTLPKIKANDSMIKEIALTSKGKELKSLLGVELPMLEKLIIDGEEDEEIVSKEDEEEIVENASTDVKTEEIQENNINAKFNNTY